MNADRRIGLMAIATMLTIVLPAAAVCYVQAPSQMCCVKLGPVSGPDVNRWCGLPIIGNYCNDVVTADALSTVVIEALIGKSQISQTQGPTCTFIRKDCALIGCKTVGTVSVNCTNESVSGSSCDESGSR